MFVLTVDQRDSRSGADAVAAALPRVAARAGTALLLAPERTVGDEFQLAVGSAAAALDVLLDLTRTGTWSVGLGVGAVDDPLPPTVREARGPAFVAARAAVERAKRSATHAAVECPASPTGARDLQAFLDLLLLVRERRTPAGWALADLLAEGLTQQDAAARLGITPQSASQRARIAGVRAEDAATAALVNLLTALDERVEAEELS